VDQEEYEVDYKHMKWITSIWSGWGGIWNGVQGYEVDYEHIKWITGIWSRLQEYEVDYKHIK